MSLRVVVTNQSLIHRTRNENGSDKSDPYKKKNAEFIKGKYKISSGGD